MNTDLPTWTTATIPMTRWAGRTVRIILAAADLGRPSTIEAAVDDVRVTRPYGAVGPASSCRRRAGIRH
jgi:hypothetical protein